MADEEQTRCWGKTRAGNRCKRKTSADVDRTSWRCAQHQLPEGEVGAVAGPIEPSDTGSPEERLAWLEKVRRGEVKETKVNPTGGDLEIPVSVRDRILAAKAAEDLRRELDDKRTNWVTREQFVEGCSSIALIARDRLRAVPSRMFGQDVDRVRALEAEIDAALEEAANELARTIRRVLGETHQPGSRTSQVD